MMHNGKTLGEILLDRQSPINIKVKNLYLNNEF